jgi:hypothetical protein
MLSLECRLLLLPPLLRLCRVEDVDDVQVVVEVLNLGCVMGTCCCSCSSSSSSRPLLAVVLLLRGIGPTALNKDNAC